MGMIDNDWLPALKPEFAKTYYKDLFEFVKTEYSRVVVYPPADDIFNAFHFTPLSKVKVVILGQDPYHNVNQAHGLAFQCRRVRRRYRRRFKIYTRNCMTILAVIYQTTVTSKNGRIRGCLC